MNRVRKLFKHMKPPHPYPLPRRRGRGKSKLFLARLGSGAHCAQKFYGGSHPHPLRESTNRSSSVTSGSEEPRKNAETIFPFYSHPSSFIKGVRSVPNSLSHPCPSVPI